MTLAALRKTEGLSPVWRNIPPSFGLFAAFFISLPLGPKSSHCPYRAYPSNPKSKFGVPVPHFWNIMSGMFPSKKKKDAQKLLTRPDAKRPCDFPKSSHKSSSPEAHGAPKVFPVISRTRLVQHLSICLYSVGRDMKETINNQNQLGSLLIFHVHRRGCIF